MEELFSQLIPMIVALGFVYWWRKVDSPDVSPFKASLFYFKDLINPVPSVLRFETNGNERTNGGIFSLDCFHPTAIGHGLIAEKFICAMKKAGVCPVNRSKSDWKLDWKEIIESDTLIKNPPELWDDAINLAKKHSGLAGILHRIFT